jgi:DDE superfamily endonuclease
MNDRDPEFATKAVAVIELLLSPPTDGPLFCVDEKPGIGVRQPTAPDQPPAPGRPARREFEYKRNGTVDLLAGFRVNDGQVCGMVRLQHRSREFCELLALLDEQTPVGKPIHLILDPVSSHWSAEVASWLDTHPQRTFVFHFLPVHASWLSFIEVWFSILSRKCLRRADFADATIATEQIEGFMATYNTHMAHPFEWKKGVRFYKRLKDSRRYPSDEDLTFGSPGMLAKPVRSRQVHRVEQRREYRADTEAGLAPEAAWSPARCQIRDAPGGLRRQLGRQGRTAAA